MFFFYLYSLYQTHVRLSITYRVVNNGYLRVVLNHLKLTPRKVGDYFKNARTAKDVKKGTKPYTAKICYHTWFEAKYYFIL